MTKDKPEGFDHHTLERLRTELPPVFGRPAIDKLLPGVITQKTLANLAALGEGPEYKMVRRRCVYDRDVFLEWLEGQTR